MTSIILLCLIALALAAFALNVGMGLSWLWTGVLCLVLAVLMVLALWRFQREGFTAWRDHFVDDVGSIWKRWSVWIQAGQMALMVYYASLPAKVQDAIPPTWLALSAAIGGLATLTVMAIKQKNLPEK